jgi:hypothetical protein
VVTSHGDAVTTAPAITTNDSSSRLYDPKRVPAYLAITPKSDKNMAPIACGILPNNRERQSELSPVGFHLVEVISVEVLMRISPVDIAIKV